MTRKTSNTDRARECLVSFGIYHSSFGPTHLSTLAALLDSVAAEAEAKGRREGIEEAAEYVATHYPVFVSLQGPSRWDMVASTEGGRVQEQYASAIRALLPAKEEPNVR